MSGPNYSTDAGDQGTVILSRNSFAQSTDFQCASSVVMFAGPPEICFDGLVFEKFFLGVQLPAQNFF
jgi:hypothetical protein